MRDSSKKTVKSSRCRFKTKNKRKEKLLQKIIIPKSLTNTRENIFLFIYMWIRSKYSMFDRGFYYLWNIIKNWKYECAFFFRFTLYFSSLFNSFFFWKGKKKEKYLHIPTKFLRNSCIYTNTFVMFLYYVTFLAIIKVFDAHWKYEKFD